MFKVRSERVLGRYATICSARHGEQFLDCEDVTANVTLRRFDTNEDEVQAMP